MYYGSYRNHKIVPNREYQKYKRLFIHVGIDKTTLAYTNAILYNEIHCLEPNKDSNSTYSRRQSCQRLLVLI